MAGTDTPHALPGPLAARLRALVARPGRVLLGITGPPGAGKSTLAAAVACAAGGAPGACVVPMDGFHLAQAVLVARGLAHRKGAAVTFDAHGYVALLGRIRAGTHTVYAPQFRRELEEPVAGAIPVEAAARLVVTEGNYLLRDEEPWRAVAPLLDECWYLEPDDAVRRARLHARHVAFGRSDAEAQAWMTSNDDVNAREIAATAGRADLVWRG